MSSSPPTSNAHPELRASYSNASTTPATSSEPFVLAAPLPSVPSSSSSSSPPTAYLAALRSAVVATQLQINEALTARMEEDKAREAAAATEGGAAAAGNSASNKKRQKGPAPAVDEDAEEENYGEEVVEED
ncbi:uncharacterized protein JN550_012445 [Neoarthrinium moseri]|uniref:uncharacterized protein n=1 Tax=Neoarthrinium moseri TaxID=1658444 RepID=UPI001FDB0548|nr:uncharacterized protein JN550_012445 [Neoarthrinium moseri]KAI1858791.1 hypothetical protein JN550_012445 [Neoarthrinium moseri]